MSYRLARLGVGLGLAALVAGGPWVCAVRAGGKDPGKAIEFSNPKSDELSTNLHQLRSKKDSLKELEEDLSKSMRSFSGAIAAPDAARPPEQPVTRPVIPNKRLKELMERRKFEFLLTPDDLAHVQTLEEMLKVPEYGRDGAEKQQKSPLELYYERQDAKRARSLSPIHFGEDDPSAKSDLPNDRNTSAASDDPRLPAALKEKTRALEKLLQSDATGDPLSPVPAKSSSFSDPFGLGQPAPSPASVLEHKKNMEAFSAIWEPSPPQPAIADAAKLPGASTDSARQLANPFGVPDTSSAGAGPLSSVNPIFSPTAPVDVNDQMFGRSKQQMLPNTDVSKPVAPTFAAPQRPPI